MTDDQIKRVVFEHTKLNPSQADDQVLHDGIVRAVRELMAQNLVGYVHADGDRFMSLDIFDAWSKLRATPEQAAQYQPVYWGAPLTRFHARAVINAVGRPPNSHGNQTVPNDLRGDEVPPS